MNVLAIGAAGFIAPAHVRMLRADEASDAPRTTALDRLARAGTLDHPELGRPRLEFVQGDIREAGPADEPTADADQVVPSVTQSHIDRSIASANDCVLRWEARGADPDRVDPVGDSKGHDPLHRIDRPGARTEFGNRPRRDFASGPARTVAPCRDHRAWWKPLKRHAQGLS